MKKIFVLLTIAVSLFSCGNGRKTTVREEGDTLSFKYARLIEVVRYADHTEVNIKNPWKEGKTLHRYYFVPSAETTQQAVDDGMTLVRVPLQRSVVFTSVHAALLGQLDADSQVTGVADLKYMKVPYIQEGVKAGRIIDCGDGMSPVIEKIIDADADAILLSPFENSGGYGKLEDIDIPLIECAEYMEQSPLARAEWIRFYGMLYGHEREADSLFAIVDSSYHALKEMVKTSTTMRSVLMDKQTGSVWYVPGGQSTIGQMLSDARCVYPFASDKRSGSLAMPFESMLEKCGEADVWMFRYDAPQPITRKQLLSEQPGYKQLRPAKTGELYGCNVTTSMFYEESPFRPDLLLQDFIQILHPDITNLPPLRYYYKVGPTPTLPRGGSLE
ncbi:MAG: ABC transporter substrate-binding protein [Prevotella sp.]|nr:ABC transporter substrate-binding protein [Prevotella sp.]